MNDSHLYHDPCDCKRVWLASRSHVNVPQDVRPVDDFGAGLAGGERPLKTLSLVLRGDLAGPRPKPACSLHPLSFYPHVAPPLTLKYTHYEQPPNAIHPPDSTAPPPTPYTPFLHPYVSTDPRSLMGTHTKEKNGEIERNREREGVLPLRFSFPTARSTLPLNVRTCACFLRFPPSTGLFMCHFHPPQKHSPFNRPRYPSRTTTNTSNSKRHPYTLALELRNTGERLSLYDHMKLLRL